MFIQTRSTDSDVLVHGNHDLLAPSFGALTVFGILDEVGYRE